MQLNLNIYKGRQIEKVYIANEFDIMFGTVEDLVDLIDTDRLTGEVTDTDFIGAVAVLLKGGLGRVKNLMFELFPELTEEELRRTKTREIIGILAQVLKYGFAGMAGAANSKN